MAEKKQGPGRPPGATNKSLSKQEFERLIKSNSKEAITRIVAHMRAEDDNLSYRACVKVLEMAKDLFKEEGDFDKMLKEVEDNPPSGRQPAKVTSLKINSNK